MSFDLMSLINAGKVDWSKIEPAGLKKQLDISRYYHNQHAHILSAAAQAGASDDNLQVIIDKMTDSEINWNFAEYIVEKGSYVATLITLTRRVVFQENINKGFVMAAGAGNLQQLELLKLHYAEVDFVAQPHQRTALIHAAANCADGSLGHLECIKQLIKYGADVDRVVQTDTALELAVFNENLDAVIELVLGGAKTHVAVSIADAEKNGYAEIAKILKDSINGKKPMRRDPEDFWQKLHWDRLDQIPEQGQGEGFKFI